MLKKLKQRLVSWMLKDVHLEKIQIGEHSVSISSTGVAMGNQKVSAMAVPTVTGDGLRKGTPVTPTELPNLAKDKIWKGNASNRPAEIDPPYGVLDCWSVYQEEVAVTGTAGPKTLPSVTIANLPSGATIIKAIAMFKFGMKENTYAGANALNGAQEIQVKPTAGSFTDAINFVNGQFALAQDTREGGDVAIGIINVAGSGKVEANGLYEFLWDQAIALGDGIKFNDVQVGLRIWYG